MGSITVKWSNRPTTFWNPYGTEIQYYDTASGYKTATLYIGLRYPSLAVSGGTSWDVRGTSSGGYGNIQIVAYIAFPSGASVSTSTGLNYVSFISASYYGAHYNITQPGTISGGSTTKIALSQFKTTYTKSSPYVVGTLNTSGGRNIINPGWLTANDKFVAHNQIGVGYKWQTNSTGTTKTKYQYIEPYYETKGLYSYVQYDKNGWAGTLPATTPSGATGSNRAWAKYSSNITLGALTSITSKKTNCDGQTYTATFGFWTTKKYKSTDSDDIPKQYKYKSGATFNVDTYPTTLYARCGYPSGKIVFKGNGATGGSQSSKTPTVRSSTESKYKLPTTTGYTRLGYTFAGWYDVATGGTQWTQMTNGIAKKTYTFYAHWTPNSYVVTFNKQSGTGGTNSVTIVYDTTNPLPTVTLPTRTNYDFMGYFTETGGKGVKRITGIADATAGVWVDTTNTTFTGPTTLYAYWVESRKRNEYAVTYYKGQADTGSLPANQIKYEDISLTLAGNAGNLAKGSVVAHTHPYTLTFNYNGADISNITSYQTTVTTTTPYEMDGWSTTNSATAARAYTLGGSYTTNAALNLYPHFTAGTATTVTQNTVTLPTPTRTGYTFGGWYNTSASTGGTKIGDGGATYTVTSTQTIYARWTKITYNIKYIYDSTTITDVKDYNVPYTIRGYDLFSRPGYELTGWNTNTSGTGTNYTAGQVYTTNAALTLYPKWTALPVEKVYIIQDMGMPNSATVPATQEAKIVWDINTTASKEIARVIIIPGGS